MSPHKFYKARRVQSCSIRDSPPYNLTITIYHVLESDKTLQYGVLQGWASAEHSSTFFVGRFGCDLLVVHDDDDHTFVREHIAPKLKSLDYLKYKTMAKDLSAGRRKRLNIHKQLFMLN